MGFIDVFKRWRLAQKGMSSGKKRRTATKAEGVVAESIGSGVWVRFLLYGVFILLVCLFVPSAQRTDSLYSSSESVLSHRVMVCLVLSLAMILYYHIRESVKVQNGRVVLIFGGVMINLLIVWSVVCLMTNNPLWSLDYLFIVPPLAFAPMLLSVLAGRHAGVLAAISTGLFGSLMMPETDVFAFIVINIVAGSTAVAMTRKVRKRGSLLRAGFYVGLVMLILAVVFEKIDLSILFSAESMSAEASKIGIVMIGGILTGMVVSGVLPALESIFSLTTSISWLEMSDLNHKLLRRLQLEAPGTYHHSMVVATLAESAAEKIGADASMCRVCSYFHDIGKLKKPEYFIENQGEINPHDSLSPTMSAIVVIAHVKDGVDMAIKHKLNPKIVDVIREHHGKSMVKYFYHKACEQRLANEQGSDDEESKESLPEVDKKSFRYPVAYPSTRESGIISLADCVESASRSLSKPNPQKIYNLVHDIVMDRVIDSQLDHSSLTMGEIKQLIDSFSSTLRSMMHTRIDYPKDDESKSSDDSTMGGSKRRLG